MARKIYDLKEAVENAVEAIEEIENFRDEVEADIKNLIDFIGQFDDGDEKSELLTAIEGISEDLNNILSKLK
ncbi:seryl-tRNA synthetase [Cytobacillus horneckiae]|uniref:hypothetical protein n=1 Tax=Cytobacillus horneckiae TaxID=549687 RepID=UPI0019D1661E|nr:hypothetical protein [Cytobacillus horneckiae]MBN6887757.1 hypothetical protein [Cytobacillus horneckiae]